MNTRLSERYGNAQWRRTGTGVWSKIWRRLGIPPVDSVAWSCIMDMCQTIILKSLMSKCASFIHSIKYLIDSLSTWSPYIPNCPPGIVIHTVIVKSPSMLSILITIRGQQRCLSLCSLLKCRRNANLAQDQFKSKSYATNFLPFKAFLAVKPKIFQKARVSDPNFWCLSLVTSASPVCGEAGDERCSSGYLSYVLVDEVKMS